jgi:hypothetical protein
MGDTNRVQLSYIEEGSFGDPVTGAHLQVLRVTSENLARQVTSSKSAEIRANRRTANYRTTGRQAGGSIGGELSYGTWNTWLQYGLLSAAPVAAISKTASTISAASADNSFNDSGSGFTFTANHWVYVTGFSGAAIGNNGFCKIVSATTAKIVVSGKTLVTATAGDSITIKQGAYLVDGTTLKTMNIERAYLDLSNDLVLFTGMAITAMNMGVTMEGIVTVGFDLIGADEDSLAASGGNGYDDAPTADPFQAADVMAILENGAAASVLDFTLAYNNNLRTRRKIGPVSVLSIGTGEIVCEGSLRCYYESKTLYDKFLDEDASWLALCLTDLSGNHMVIDIPRIRYIGGQRSTPGPNGDVVADMNWGAYENTSDAGLLQIAFFPVA